MTFLAAGAAFVGSLVVPATPGAGQTEDEPAVDQTAGNETVDADRVPGDGTTITMSRATWDTGWFQAEIMARLLRELGYRVDGPRTADNEEFYDDLTDGATDLWVNGWFPLHQSFVEGRDAVVPIGLEVDGGALQGYAIDRASIDRLGIETLADLADPSIAAEFDLDDDGMADLVGCNDEWACAPIVDHHLDELGLGDTVEHVQGDYGPLMHQVVDRFRAGEPVLYYTFTPNWTVGALQAGADVAWVPVPDATTPDGAAVAPVAGVEGCLNDPCPMGFPRNDIRSVASRDLLESFPAIESLLADFTVPLDDISAQNARMVSGAADAADIDAHAAEWIDDHRDLVDTWLAAATDAHVAAGGELHDPPAAVDSSTAEPVGSISVVTRLAPPFVTYTDGDYAGFSLELWELIARDIGAEFDVTAVNSNPKLIDEVLRGSADVGVSAVGVTPSREAEADFSHPYLDTGLQILVASDSDAGFLGGTIGSVFRQLFSSRLLAPLAVLLVALTVAAHLIWLAERRRNPDFPREYLPGIREAFWWSAVTATTVGYGDKTPRGSAGRAVGIVWMFAGLFILAYFTAGMTTTFTLDEIEGSINSEEDLPGHKVAVAEASIAEGYLDNTGVAATSFPTIDGAYDALVDGDVDAVVHDAPILQHHATNEGAGDVRLVGLPFHHQQYAFVVDFDDPLRERINIALLEIIESGEYETLHDRWFGQ